MGPNDAVDRVIDTYLNYGRKARLCGNRLSGGEDGAFEVGIPFGDHVGVEAGHAGRERHS